MRFNYFLVLLGFAALVKGNIAEKGDHVGVSVLTDIYSTLTDVVEQGYAATAKAINASRAAVLPAILASENIITDTFNSISNALIDLAEKDQELAHAIKLSEDVWPAGSYCILAAGTCPAGFCRKEGHIHGIQQFAPFEDTFLKPVKFGDSSVSHHTYRQLANIDISACCKGHGC